LPPFAQFQLSGFTGATTSIIALFQGCLDDVCCKSTRKLGDLGTQPTYKEKARNYAPFLQSLPWLFQAIWTADFTKSKGGGSLCLFLGFGVANVFWAVAL